MYLAGLHKHEADQWPLLMTLFIMRGMRAQSTGCRGELLVSTFLGRWRWLQPGLAQCLLCVCHSYGSPEVL